MHKAGGFRCSLKHLKTIFTESLSMCCSEQLGGPDWRTRSWKDQVPPPLVDIWNFPEKWKKGLSKNVIGVIEQVPLKL